MDSDRTAKIQKVWQEFAPRYDKTMAFFERWQFGGGRQGRQRSGGGACLGSGGSGRVPGAPVLSHATTVTAGSHTKRRVLVSPADHHGPIVTAVETGDQPQIEYPGC